MFAHLDEDGSGEIDIEEWRRGYHNLPGGPWHDEILVMGELLRRDRQATVTTDGQKKAGERIVKLLEKVHARTLTRAEWELRVKEFLVEGHVRACGLFSLPHSLAPNAAPTCCPPSFPPSVRALCPHSAASSRCVAFPQ